MFTHLQAANCGDLGAINKDTLRIIVSYYRNGFGQKGGGIILSSGFQFNVGGVVSRRWSKGILGFCFSPNISLKT